MSRARQNSTGRLRLAPAAVVGIALALAGCSAGQIAQTSRMEPAVNGGMGQAGAIAVRNVQLAYPPDGVYRKGSNAALLATIVNGGVTDDELVSVTTPAGTVTITGDRKLPAGRMLVAEGGDVKTVTTSSPTTTSTTTTGSTTTGTTTTGSTTTSTTTTGSATTTGSQPPPSGSGSAPATTATTKPPTSTSVSPADIGKVTIVINNLAQDIWSGHTIDVTFVFRNSGQTTVTVPIAVPTTPRQPPAVENP